MADERNLEMPGTNTPLSVFVVLFLMAVLIGLGLYALLGFVGIILLFVILGITTGTYLESVPGYQAMILLNHFSGKQRTIFQGMHLKLPWESQTQMVDLRVDLKEVLEETYASKDALMETKYVYTIRPDVSGKTADPGRNIILYATFETSALKQEGRALFSMLLSDYYRIRSGDELKNKNDINNAVFKGNPLIQKFEKFHGAKVSVRLEDSDFDAATQKFRDMVSGAKSLNEAVEKLMQIDPDTKIASSSGMSRDQAIRIAKLMNLEGYTERKFDISVDAPDLKNLRDVTVLGGALSSEKKGGKK